MDINIRKESLLKLHENLSTLVEVIDLIYEAFRAHRMEHLDEAGELIVGVHRRCDALRNEMLGDGQGQASDAACVMLPAHVSKMVENAGHLSGAVRNKIATNMLFSDMAISELDVIFTRTRDLVLNAGQIVLTQRVLLRRHLMDSSRTIQALADDAATKHQERLIEGLCIPAFSVVYIAMLDAFRAIAWYCREITRDIEAT